jgi:hypothetical protein
MVSIPLLSALHSVRGIPSSGGASPEVHLDVIFGARDEHVLCELTTSVSIGLSSCRPQ